MIGANRFAEGLGIEPCTEFALVEVSPDAQDAFVFAGYGELWHEAQRRLSFAGEATLGRIPNSAEQLDALGGRAFVETGEREGVLFARLHRYGLRPPRNDIQVLMSRVRPGYLPIFIELAKSRLPTDSAHGSEDIAEALAATWKAIPTHDSRGERTNETQPMPIDVALHRWMAQAGR